MTDNLPECLVEWEGPVLYAKMANRARRATAVVYGSATLSAKGTRTWGALVLDNKGNTLRYSTVDTEGEARVRAEKAVAAMLQDELARMPSPAPAPAPVSWCGRSSPFMNVTPNTYGMCRVDGDTLMYCGAGVDGFVRVAEVCQNADGDWTAFVYMLPDGVDCFAGSIASFVSRGRAEMWALDIVAVMLERDHRYRMGRTRLVKGRQR